MEFKLITVERARQKLGEKGKSMSDQEIQKLLNHLYYICNKTIEYVTNKNAV